MTNFTTARKYNNSTNRLDDFAKFHVLAVKYEKILCNLQFIPLPRKNTSGRLDLIGSNVHFAVNLLEFVLGFWMCLAAHNVERLYHNVNQTSLQFSLTQKKKEAKRKKKGKREKQEQCKYSYFNLLFRDDFQLTNSQLLLYHFSCNFYHIFLLHESLCMNFAIQIKGDKVFFFQKHIRSNVTADASLRGRQFFPSSLSLWQYKCPQALETNFFQLCQNPMQTWFT